MTTQEGFLGLVDAGREIRRPPVVGMQFLHERPVSARDVVPARAFPKAENFIRFLLGHSGAPHARAPRPLSPRVRIALTCMTPAGKPAVEIRF